MKTSSQNNAGDEPGTLPATKLQELAALIAEQPSPVNIRDNKQRAALAAEALWLFASRTGLAQDGETFENVLLDFMADMLHLCRQTGFITDERDLLEGILRPAMVFCDMDSPQ